MNVIGVSGLPGSGKNIISKIAKERSINVIKMGNIVREEAEKRDGDPGKTAVDLRKEHGEYVLAKLTIEKIKGLSNLNKSYKNSKKANIDDFFVIEGIRSQFEIELFRKNFKNFKLISVFSSPNTRFNRLKNRQRDDDSQEYEDFIKRDQRELNFGIGNVIATSDFIIINENGIDEYKTQINDIFDNLLFC